MKKLLSNSIFLMYLTALIPDEQLDIYVHEIAYTNRALTKCFNHLFAHILWFYS